MTFAVTLPNADVLASRSRSRTFYTRLLEQLRSSGGVQSVAAMTGLPPLRQVNANDTNIEGYVAPPEGPFANVDYYNTVTTGYVETMGIPVRRRTRVSADRRARHHGDDQPDDGADLLQGSEPDRPSRRPSGPPSANIPWFTIVGVLKDVKQGGVDKKTGTELYFNFEQLTTNAAANFGPGTMNIVMRTTQPLDALAGDRFAQACPRSIRRCRS